VILVVTWLASTVLEMNSTIAGLKPVISRMEATTASIVGRDTYDRDQTRHDQDAQRVTVQLNDLATRVQELRLEMTRLDLRMSEHIHVTVKEVTT
jgi:hypothetical protein